MTSNERSNLVLAFARTLFANGQATDQTAAAAERLGRAMGLRANVMARWGELQLQSDSAEGNLICQEVADPAGVDMDRVTSAMRGHKGCRVGGGWRRMPQRSRSCIWPAGERRRCL